MSGQLNHKSLRRDKRQTRDTKQMEAIKAREQVVKRNNLDNLLGVEIAREQALNHGE